MSRNAVQNDGEPCPKCKRPLLRISGPAEEERHGRKHLYALEVLRCHNCGYAEVVSKVDTTEELDRLLGRKAKPIQPRFSFPDPGSLLEDDYWKR